jgi:hypothetical protein
MRKLFVLLFVGAAFALACNNSPETPVATANVDSATKAASDTLRPSADTTARVVDTTKTADTAGKKTL